MTAPLASLLIVEDDPEISRLLADFLQREGFEVECADSGKAMDAVLQRMRPDLLVLDLMLPGEDGLSICRRLRADDNIPILMLTAKSDEIDRVVGLEMGADDYLTKPFRKNFRSGATRSTGSWSISIRAASNSAIPAMTPCNSPARNSTCSAASCCGRAGC